MKLIIQIPCFNEEHTLPLVLADLPREVDGFDAVQSLILGAVLFNAAMVLAALGVMGDLLAAQRTMAQRTFERVRRIELQLGVAPSHYEPGAGGDDSRSTTGAGAGAATGKTEERDVVAL